MIITEDEQATLNRLGKALTKLEGEVRQLEAERREIAGVVFTRALRDWSWSLTNVDDFDLRLTPTDPAAEKALTRLAMEVLHLGWHDTFGMREAREGRRTYYLTASVDDGRLRINFYGDEDDGPEELDAYFRGLEVDVDLTAWADRWRKERVLVVDGEIERTRSKLSDLVAKRASLGPT